MLAGDLGELGVGERVATFAPGGEAAFERANARDALFSEEQRHTGAGGFVRSSTVENDFLIAGKKFSMLLQIAGVHVQGAGNGFGVGFKLHRVTQVHDGDFFASVEPFLQFIHSDAGDTQLAQEAAAADVFVAEIADESGDQQDDEATAERGGAFGNVFDFAAEGVAETEESAGPDRRARGIKENEAAHTHMKDAGQRRRHGAKAGDELGEEQRTRALFREEAFGAADTGIGLDGNAAEPLKDDDATGAAELIPERIGGNGSECGNCE